MPAVVNTELGCGLPDTRGVKKLEPEEVAEAIVEAIEIPKFDVWVPASSAVIDKLITPAPPRPGGDRPASEGGQGARRGRRGGARRLRGPRRPL